MLRASLVRVAFMVLLSAPRAPGKWEGPWMPKTSGKSRIVMYYGPWQCRQDWFDSCKIKCSEEGYPFKGCIWLADMKTEREVDTPIVDVVVGGRLAFTQCCCDRPKAEDRAERRETWKRNRPSYRDEWAKEYGAWPTDQDGNNWPGHHTDDLLHGGDPLSGVLPVPPDIHTAINSAYLACYAGGGHWSTPGPEKPYAD